MNDNWQDMLAGKKFDVEHALTLESRSSLILPAGWIYDNKRLEPFLEGIKDCHVYMIGHLPIMEMNGVGRIENAQLITSYLIAGKEHELRWNVPPGSKIEKQNGNWWVSDPEGKQLIPEQRLAQRRLSNEQNALPFNVLYIGQAFGTDGSRNALERLQKHEKLQEIALKQREVVPNNHRLSTLLLEMERNTELVTMFNSFAQSGDNTYERILNGLKKLDETTEAEKTTLYEASLISHFQPRFNKEFKDSFPSTNMKVLTGCYERDITAIIANLAPNAEFQVCSDIVSPKKEHVIQIDLHDDKARRVFLGLTD